MRRLCFGSSFNPVHDGHLRCAEAAAAAGRFDRIVLIPSGLPPHKAGTTVLASPADRLAMCRLVAQQNAAFEVDDLELGRAGPSYTIDTVRALRERGWSEITWLIGADMAEYLPHWHEAVRLLSEVQFLIVARPGWSLDWAKLPAPFRRLERNVVAAPLLDISSTEIRRRVRANEPINQLVPAAVEKYIREHDLYR